MALKISQESELHPQPPPCLLYTSTYLTYFTHFSLHIVWLKTYCFESYCFHSSTFTWHQGPKHQTWADFFLLYWCLMLVPIYGINQAHSLKQKNFSFFLICLCWETQNPTLITFLSYISDLVSELNSLIDKHGAGWQTRRNQRGTLCYCRVLNNYILKSEQCFIHYLSVKF